MEVRRGKEGEALVRAIFSEYMYGRNNVSKTNGWTTMVRAEGVRKRDKSLTGTGESKEKREAGWKCKGKTRWGPSKSKVPRLKSWFGHWLARNFSGLISVLSRHVPRHSLELFPINYPLNNLSFGRYSTNLHLCFPSQPNDCHPLFLFLRELGTGV